MMGSKNPGCPSRRNRANEPAYVLFASTFAREFYAVVPTYNPIPNLLLSPGWRFVRILKGRNARQPCLRGKSAMTAFARDGYYLFTNRQFAPELPKPASGSPENPGASSSAAGHMLDRSELSAASPDEGALRGSVISGDDNRPDAGAPAARADV